MTKDHLVYVPLDDSHAVEDWALLHGREVQVLVFKHEDVLVVDEGQLPALFGIVEITFKHVILGVALLAKRLVAEHHVDLLALPSGLVREEDAADLACLAVEGVG